MFEYGLPIYREKLHKHQAYRLLRIWLASQKWPLPRRAQSLSTFRLQAVRPIVAHKRNWDYAMIAIVFQVVRLLCLRTKCAVSIVSTYRLRGFVSHAVAETRTTTVFRWIVRYCLC